MQFGVLGWRSLVLLAVALGGGCARAPAIPVAAVARPSAPVFIPPAISACPLGKAPVVWLPGAEQLLAYCDNMLELRDAVSGAVLAQRLAIRPSTWRDSIQRVGLSPDGTRLALASYGSVEMRELPGLTLLWSAAVSANSLRFSTDSRQIRVDDGATTLAFSVADGQRVEPTAPSVAKRWQGSFGLNEDDTLAFEIVESKLTVWDPKKDVALLSFEMPKGFYGPPVWVGHYLGFRLSEECLLVDAREPQRRFSLKGASSLEQVALSRDEARLRSSQQGELLEWRLGEAVPAVLGAPSPDRIWLGPRGIRAEARSDALTVWRQTAAGERVAQRAWVRPAWVEFGPAGEVVAGDLSRPRLLVLGAASAAREIPLAAGEKASLAAFEPAGSRFVAAAGRKLRVYRQPTLDVQQTIELPFEPALLAWRAESPELLVADAERLYGVALAGGKVTPLEGFANVKRIAVSPDGTGVAIAALRDGKPELTLRSRTGLEHAELTSALEDLRFSPDGKALWALQEHTLLTLRLPLSKGAVERSERRPIAGKGWVTHLAPTGEVYCMGERLRLANENGDLLPEPFPVALQPAWSEQGLVLTSDARQLAPTLISFPAGAAVAQPPPKTPQELPPMPRAPLVSGAVRAWAVNAERSVLATLDGNSTVNTFSTSGGLGKRLSESASALIRSEDASSLLVVAGDARSLTLWNTQTWQPRIELRVAERIDQVAVSKDGARVAVLDDHGTLQVVFADRSLHRYALRPDMGVRGLVFEPSGQYLVLGGLPLRIVRLTDGVLLYGYTASLEAKEPAVVAWVSEKGLVAGDRRALPNPTALRGQQSPELLQSFFTP
jgi:hypothetical protein